MRDPRQRIEFQLNGAKVAVQVEPVRRLADVLRDELGLTGTKIGCNAGDCGACTVLLDGAQICACLAPIAQIAGRDVTTVEGLAAMGELTALQRAFHRHGAAQCGICTPGMILAAHHLLNKKSQPTLDDIREGLSGNLCRCTGYLQIFEAVAQAAHRGAAT